jgi:hypothetical protein
MTGERGSKTRWGLLRRVGLIATTLAVLYLLTGAALYQDDASQDTCHQWSAEAMLSYMVAWPVIMSGATGTC